MNREKLFKVGKGLLIISIITGLLMCVSLGIGASKYFRKESTEPVSYYSAKSEVDRYVSMNVIYLSSFAEKSGKVYYLAEDANDYYVIVISDRVFDKMKKEYETSGYLNYPITGYVRKLDSDVIDLGVEAVQEIYEVSDFTRADFNYYYGFTYLDTTYSPYHEDGGLFLGLGFALACFCIPCLLIYLSNKKRVNKILNVFDEDRILSWIEDPQTEEFSKLGLFFTKDHLISREGKNGPIKAVVNYADIAWSYLVDHKYYFVTVSKEILLWLKNGTSVTVGSVSPKDKEGLIDKFYNLLMEKNDDILIGYNSQNITRYNEFKKLYKETQDDTMRVTGPKDSDFME